MIFNPLKPINEVYIGKTPRLLAIERELDKFRNKYISNQKLARSTASSDPDLLKINRMFEDYFGFSCLSISIWHRIEPNAFTLSLSRRYDVAMSVTKNFYIDKEGYKFKKESGYSCIIVVYDSIMFNSRFTTGEVMACILHEIGHNFNLVMEQRHGLFSRLYYTTLAINKLLLVLIPSLLITNNSLINKLNLAEQSLQKDHKTIADIGNNAIWSYQAIKDILTLPKIYKRLFTAGLSKFFDLLERILDKIIWTPDELITDFAIQPIGYAHEREADNFATIHGYGAEITSLMNKFTYSNTDDILMRNLGDTFYGRMYATNIFLIEMITDPFDVHPRGGNRIQDQLDLLKHEMSKEDLDPKLKKEILADIKACETQINKLVDTTKGVKDPDFVRHAYWRILYKHTNTRTSKDMLMSLILGSPDHRFDEYDKVYGIHKV